MCCIIKIFISNWPRTRKFGQLLQAQKTVALDFSHHVHALIMLYIQFLCSDWSKFDRWVHVEIYAASWSLFTLTAEADKLTECCVNFTTCDVFNCLFPLDVQNEIQLLSGVPCYSSLVCLLGFWLRNTSLVKVGWHRFRFHLAWCVRGLKCLKRYWPYLIPSRS